MTVFLVTLGIFALALVCLVGGQWLTGRCLRGSCGGHGAEASEAEAERCEGCPNRQRD
jgi:hypothetical protein